MLPSSSQWYQVHNLIFVHPSFAAAEVLLLRACLEGLISPGSEHCNRVLWRSRRTLRTLAPPAPPLCSCILPKPEPASSALQCSTVLYSVPVQGAGAVESGCQTASKYWSTCHLFSSLWRWHATIVDAVYLQISWYFFKYLHILLQCKELQFLEIDRIDEQCVCMEDLIYYLYKNQVNLFNVMPSI